MSLLSTLRPFSRPLLAVSLLLSSLVCTGYAGGPASQLRRPPQTELLVTINRGALEAYHPKDIKIWPRFLPVGGGPSMRLFHGAWLQHATRTRTALTQCQSMGALPIFRAQQRGFHLKTVPAGSDEPYLG